MLRPPATPVEELGRRITDISYDSLPGEVVARAKDCLLDQFGVQLRGATLAYVQPALQVARRLQAAPQSTITLYGDRTSPPLAAFVNATFGHSCEYDDAHFLCGHPGVCTIPAGLAFAEACGASGKDLIRAVVAGYQACALSLAPVHDDTLVLGWHGMKVSGVFGAAATAGVLLGLDAEQMTNALAIAASEAGGTMEYDQSGGEVKRLHAGMASRSGTMAAMLAQEGLTGPHTIFEGPRGIWRLFGKAGAPPRRELQSADRWQILDTIFKLYPCVGTLHAALDAVRMIQSDHTLYPDDIDSIEVGLADWAVPHGGTITRPTDVISAQFSLGYSVALRVVRNSNEVGLYMDPEAWTDPELLEVIDRVRPYPMPVAPGEELGAKVTVTTRDGRRIEASQPAFRGWHTNPACSRDIEEKFFETVAAVVPQAQSQELADAVRHVEDVDDVATLAALLVAQPCP
jgi:2-methylcitrate dehydratase PrpD